MIYLTMGDSTIPASIPATVDVVAGYTTGIWPTYWLLPGLFPGKPRFAFSIAADTWGDALDIEQGDASIGQAPGWARTIWKPVNTDRPHLYINAANVQPLVDTMTAAGWNRDSYVLGSAHYWGPLHICGPATCNQTGGPAAADWTQWASYPGYDLSTIPADLLTGDAIVTDQDKQDIITGVINALRVQESPGNELSDREKALVQNAIQQFVPGDIATALKTLPAATITLTDQQIPALGAAIVTALAAALKGPTPPSS